MNQMKRMPVLLLSFLVMLANLGVPMAQAGTTNQASPLYAIEMPGSSSGYLEVTHNTSFDYNGGAITIEAWVKYNASSGAMTIAGNGQNSSFWLGLTASGYLSFTPGGTSRLVNSTHAITSGRWTHVAVVYISNGYRAYYINGALDSMVTSGNPALANGSITHSLFIGYDPDASGYYSGVMDELRIWKAARAPTQIADDLFTSLSGATTDVAAEWSFDGNANDSTGVNNATSHGTSLSYVIDGALPHDVTISLVSNGVTLDGNCDTTNEYPLATMLGMGNAVLYLQHTASDLWICLYNVPNSITTSEVYLDPQYTRLDPSQAEHIRLTLTRDSQALSAAVGDGNGNYTSTTAFNGQWGAHTVVSAVAPIRSVEFRISSSMLGSWGHMIGLSI